MNMGKGCTGLGNSGDYNTGNRNSGDYNDPAEVHHVDKIGMGRDRERMVHIGLRAIALCRKHHEEAHRNEKALFAKYHIYGIRLDKYLCDILRLNTDERR